MFYDEYGVTLYYKPHEPYRRAIYTFSLFRHSYSFNSSLLQMLLRIIPICQLRVSRIDVAIDAKASINEIFVGLPTTNLKMLREENTVYFGSDESNHRMVCYDKQLQLKERHGIDIDACTRLEYRHNFIRMKSLDELTWSDVQESNKYNIVHSIVQFERCYKEQYNQFIADPNFVKKSLNQAQRRDLRKYSSQYSSNVYDIFNYQAQQNSLQDLIYRPYDITQVVKAG